MFQRIQNAVRRTEDQRPEGGSETDDRRTQTGERQSLDTPGVVDAAPAAAGAEGQAPDDAVEIGQVFDVLRNRRRRDVLWDLQARSGSIAVGDLAERIAAGECEKPVDALASAERKRVYVALYQNHLPRMADVRAVEYDQHRGTVERGPQFANFTDHLPDGAGPTDDEDSTGVVQRLTGLFS